MTSKRAWVAMRLRGWNSLEDMRTGKGVEIADAPDLIGFLPVYRTKRAARADYPDGPFIEIKRTKEAK